MKVEGFMEHIFRKGKECQPILVLLHGTGGNEYSLLTVAEFLNPNASVLSIRGDVNENGMLRFFKRKAEGVYDEDDLNDRGQKLLQFIINAGKQYNFPLENVILIGFSNGANIAIELLLNHSDYVHKAILFAPMYPVKVNKLNDLSHQSIYLSMGKFDPIVPIEESENVIRLFNERGAIITSYWINSHEINIETLIQAKEWLHQK